jgi:Raf kinase inhibitor-like YbhB/YbcL family protein
MQIRFRLAALCLLLALTACAPAASTVASVEGGAGALQVTSAAFEAGGEIPQKYTCDGDNVSPPLSWSGVPEGSESLALIADDPDAPGRTFAHWVLYSLPPDQTSLDEGADAGVPGVNGAGRQGYTGPCPPSGSPHRYFFKIYALDTSLDLNPGANKAELEDAMNGHVLAQGELVGTYER